jgi:integrase/recombinase XerD
MQGKQAKILSPTQERVILRHLETTRYPWRDRVMFLLSLKAGLRAKEIAALTWGMVTDAEGRVSDTLHLQNRATKGETGGRSIPLHPDLQAALVTLQAGRGEAAAQQHPVIFSERGRGLSAAAVPILICMPRARKATSCLAASRCGRLLLHTRGADIAGGRRWAAQGCFRGFSGVALPRGRR